MPGDTGDPVRTHVLQEGGRTRPGDLELGERGLVEQSGGLPTGAMLGADGRRPEATCPARRTERGVAGRRVRLEPVHPFPTTLLPEDGTEALQAGVGRRNPERPSGLAFVSGVLDVVVGGVHLSRALESVARGSGTAVRNGASPSPRCRVRAGRR